MTINGFTALLAIPDQRKCILQQSGIFLKQNPGEANLTIDGLQEMADSNNANLFVQNI